MIKFIDDEKLNREWFRFIPRRTNITKWDKKNGSIYRFIEEIVL